MEGVELIACKMTFDMMEMKDEDMIEDVLIWDAAQFMKYAKEAKLCLFT